MIMHQPLHVVLISQIGTVYEESLDAGKNKVKVPKFKGFGTVGQAQVEYMMQLAHPTQTFCFKQTLGSVEKYFGQIDRKGTILGKWRDSRKDRPTGKIDVTARGGCDGYWEEVVKALGGKGRARVLICGGSGEGKTTLGTSLWPNLLDEGQRAVYIPYDPGSESLSGVWDDLRSKK